MINRYRRDQLGNSSLIFTLALICFVIFTMYITDVKRQADIAEARTVAPIPSIERVAIVDTYRLKAEPILPKGTFSDYELALGSEDSSIRITNDKIQKEGSINGERLFGEADYALDGSVIVYRNITGSASLFSTIGDPVEVVDADTLVFYTEPGVFSAFKTEALAIREIDAIHSSNFSSLAPKEVYFKVLNNPAFSLAFGLFAIIFGFFIVKTMRRSLSGR